MMPASKKIGIRDIVNGGFERMTLPSKSLGVYGLGQRAALYCCSRPMDPRTVGVDFSPTPPTEANVYNEMVRLSEEMAVFRGDLRNTIFVILNNSETTESQKILAVKTIPYLSSVDCKALLEWVMINPEMSEAVKDQAAMELSIGNTDIIGQKWPIVIDGTTIPTNYGLSVGPALGPISEESMIEVNGVNNVVTGPPDDILGWTIPDLEKNLKLPLKPQSAIYEPRRNLLHDLSSREPFEIKKTGGRLIILPGGEQLVRILPISSLMAWARAYMAAKAWEDAGFNYIPVEPIIGFYGQVVQGRSETDPFNIAVTTLNLCGKPLSCAYDFYDAEMQNKIFELKQRLLVVLAKIGVNHGHANDGNVVVVPEVTVDEKGVSRVRRDVLPKLYVIDFDMAQS